MATLRRRNSKWQVQVRRRGQPGVSRSFRHKADALAWARQKELEADRQGLATEHRALRDITVAAILMRYRDEVVLYKRGADRETVAINAFLRHSLSQVSLSELTPTMVAAYRDERLASVKPSSINRELDILRHAFVLARREWKVPLLENPFALVTRPRKGDARARRLTVEERARLVEACHTCRNPYLLRLVELALATGMRRGELLAARWCDLSSEARTLHLPFTKNGHARTIPLSSAAIEVLEALRKRVPNLDAHDDRLLPLTKDAVRMAWPRIVRRAGLVDLRFHDLRHEAISAFFERGLNVPEVALISGHRDPRMLFRYTHPKPEAVALKLQ